MTKHSTTATAVLGSTAVVAGLVLGAPAAAAAPAPGVETAGSTVEAAQRAFEDSWQQAPGDFLAAQAAVEAAGGQDVVVSVPGAGLRGVRPDVAQAAYDDAVAAGGRGAGTDVRSAPGAVADVPVDAFDVAGTWYHVQDATGEFWTFSGTWDFRDDYVNGSAPDDVSAVGAEVPSCWAYSSDSVRAADYQNTTTPGVAFRQSASTTANVWGVRDRASGFALLSDHGSHTVSWQRTSSGCAGEPLRASYFYEKNQDGSGGWSASVGVAGLGVSYSGSGGSTLQKSSDLVSTS